VRMFDLMLLKVKYDREVSIGSHHPACWERICSTRVLWNVGVLTPHFRTLPCARCTESAHHRCRARSCRFRSCIIKSSHRSVVVISDWYVER
jgi:hypothetical protein